MGLGLPAQPDVLSCIWHSTCCTRRRTQRRREPSVRRRCAPWGGPCGEREGRISASECRFLTLQTIKTVTWTFAQALANFLECSLTKMLSPALIMAVCRAETLIHLSVSCGTSLSCSSCSLHSLPC